MYVRSLEHINVTIFENKNKLKTSGSIMIGSFSPIQKMADISGRLVTGPPIGFHLVRFTSSIYVPVPEWLQIINIIEVFPSPALSLSRTETLKWFSFVLLHSSFLKLFEGNFFKFFFFSLSLHRRSSRGFVSLTNFSLCSVSLLPRREK